MPIKVTKDQIALNEEATEVIDQVQKQLFEYIQKRMPHTDPAWILSQMSRQFEILEDGQLSVHICLAGEPAVTVTIKARGWRPT